MKRNQKAAHGRSRAISYVFSTERDLVFNCEERLARAKAEGVIVEYDDGRDRDPWFSGSPGPELRALRDEFLAAGYAAEARGR